MPHIHVNDIDLYCEWQGDEAKDLLILNNGIFMSTGSWVFQTPIWPVISGAVNSIIIGFLARQSQ